MLAVEIRSQVTNFAVHYNIMKEMLGNDKYHIAISPSYGSSTSLAL